MGCSVKAAPIFLFNLKLATMSDTTNIPQKVADVYEIFQNFFGEQFVDLQGGGRGNSAIMVWWPTVIVTNDNNKSVIIKDLYAKIVVTPEGRIPYESRGFQLNRTTFSNEQWTSGYLHSHIPRLYNHEVPRFTDPCLGRGPINNTIMDLKNEYEEAVWMLFCQELALYVTVESLAGGPYIRMEEIGASKKLENFKGFTEVDSISSFKRAFSSSGLIFDKMIKEFTLWYLQHGHLKFNYSEERFRCGLPYYDFMIDISNSFIEWFNLYGIRQTLSFLYSSSMILKVKVAQGKFYKNSTIDPINTSDIEGNPILIFKGEIKTLHIEPPAPNNNEYITTLLHQDVAMYILGRILRIINYRYCNEHNKLPESGSTQEGTSSTYQTVLYL